LIGGFAGIGLLFLTSSHSSSPTAVTIQSITWTVNYQGGSGTFFGTSAQNGCTRCPLDFNVSEKLPYSITIPNFSNTTAHSVTGVRVASPFALADFSPSLPASVAAGGSLTISFTILCPNHPGSWPLSGTIDAN
ncbi:MAG: hypothetical protein L3K09_07390, partial [Thermoplasmata archaeon]|nr:hypothetical protein [Thermoplasmata archaeon]